MKNESAVILLHDKLTDSLVLTERSATLSYHAGEMCFPGGIWEEGDGSLWHTALRELEEELGIASSRVTPCCELRPEVTLLGMTIHPWLADIEGLAPYTLNELEVAALVSIDMRQVRDPANYDSLTVERGGKVISCCQFTASDYLVWGATARIMKQLCDSS